MIGKNHSAKSSHGVYPGISLSIMAHLHTRSKIVKSLVQVEGLNLRS